MSYLFNFILASLIAAFTPGPNNSIAMRSGMLFGLRASFGHIWGVVVGFNILFQSLNFGLYAVFQRFPDSILLLQILGTLYFVYLAYHMLHLAPASNSKNGKEVGKMRFYQSVLFQWINVKAWFFALSVIATLPSERSWLDNLALSGVLLITSFASIFCWTLLGVSLDRLLHKWARPIGIFLALSLVYVAVSWWL